MQGASPFISKHAWQIVLNPLHALSPGAQDKCLPSPLSPAQLFQLLKSRKETSKSTLQHSRKLGLALVVFSLTPRGRAPTSWNFPAVRNFLTFLVCGRKPRCSKILESVRREFTTALDSRGSGRKVTCLDSPQLSQDLDALAAS